MTPYIFLEWMQLETSNLVCGFAAWPTKQKNSKVCQKGCGLSRVTYFYNFGTLYISGTDRVRNFKFGVRIDRRAYKPKNAKVGQKGRGLRHITYFIILGFPLYLWNR